MADMDSDWVDDEAMSREETLARFRSLHPRTTLDSPHPRGIPVGGPASTMTGNSLQDGVEIPAVAGNVFS